MSLQRSSIHVSLGSMLVYLVSFINQLLIARTFGASVRMDAYLAGANVPLIVNNLIGAVFVFAVVPHIVHEWNENESIRPKIMGLLVGCSVLAAVTVVIGLVVQVWPLSQAHEFGAYQSEAAWAAALSWGASALSIITSLSDAVFNANKRFLFPVFGYLPAYLLTAVACFTLGKSIGGAALAGATLVGYFVVIPLRVVRQKEFFVREFDYSLFRDFLAKMPFTTLAVMSLYAFPIVDTFLGPRVGEGTLSILGFATRIISTLAVIVALGPFGVLIPEIAEHSSQNHRERFAARAGTLFRYAATLLVPVAIWVTVFRLPVIVLLLQRGKFDASASQSLADLLAFNVPGSIFMVLSMLIVRVFLADKRIREAAILSTANLGLYLVLCLTLTPRFGLIGFGYAFVTSWTLHAIVALGVLFAKDREHVDFGHLSRFVPKLVATTASLLLVALGLHAVAPSGGKMTTALFLGVSFFVCLAVYFGLGNLLKSPEHQRVWRMVSGLGSRLTSRSRKA